MRTYPGLHEVQTDPEVQVWQKLGHWMQAPLAFLYHLDQQVVQTDEPGWQVEQAKGHWVITWVVGARA